MENSKGKSRTIEKQWKGNAEEKEEVQGPKTDKREEKTKRKTRKRRRRKRRRRRRRRKKKKRVPKKST